MRVKKRLLIVDGYNMIGAWPELVRLQKNARMEEARDALLETLSLYASYKNYETIVVFDAQFVPGIEQHYAYKNLRVVFTQEDETADSYIERTADDVNHLTTQVIVATSDLAVQNMMLSKKASRKSARELYNDIREARMQQTNEVGEFRLRTGNRRQSPWTTKDQIMLADLYQLLANSPNDEDKDEDLE